MNDIYNSLPKEHQEKVAKGYDSGQHVYFIRTKGRNFVKIGTARAPTLRINDLRVGNPLELKLLFVIPHGGQLIEKALHRYLKPHHVRGEWYKYDKTVIDIIKDIKRILREEKWTRQANQLLKG